MQNGFSILALIFSFELKINVKIYIENICYCYAAAFFINRKL